MTHTDTAGVRAASDGLDGLSWDILGQTYVPKSLTPSSFSWHATFPPGTFVPPHIHPDQDEFIYMLEGELTFWLDGKEEIARPGDTARLPMGFPHGIFNKSDATVKCLFWVSPTQQLFQLFEELNNLPDPDAVIKAAAKRNIHFLPPP